MLGINKVVIAGNLGRDPQIGATPKGLIVAKFSVAVSTPKKDATPKTNWFQCVATGECAQQLRDRNQGDPIYLEGSLEPYQYTPPGSRQKSTGVRVMVEKVKQPRELRTTPSLFDFAAN